MNKSKIKGVHYCSNSHKWYAKTPHKKVLFRGDSMEEAEKCRLAYDESRKKGMPLKAYKPKEKFRNCWQPNWKPSFAFEDKLKAQ